MGTNASRDQQFVTEQYDIDGYRDMLTTPEMTDRPAAGYLQEVLSKGTLNYLDFSWVI